MFCFYFYYYYYFFCYEVDFVFTCSYTLTYIFLQNNFAMLMMTFTDKQKGLDFSKVNQIRSNFIYKALFMHTA